MAVGMSDRVDQLTTNCTKISGEMQAQVAPIVGADLVSKMPTVEHNLSVGSQQSKEAADKMTKISEAIKLNKETLRGPSTR